MRVEKVQEKISSRQIGLGTVDKFEIINYDVLV